MEIEGNAGKTIKNTCKYGKEMCSMLLTYQECIEKYGTDYKIKKNVQEGKLCKFIDQFR